MKLFLYNQRLLDCCSILSILNFSSHFVHALQEERNFAPKVSSLSDVCYRDWHTFGVPETWFVYLSEKTPEKQGFFVSAEGFEPSTVGLKGRCSAVELRARHISGLHSNMGNIHRQRKTLSGSSIYQDGGSNA